MPKEAKVKKSVDAPMKRGKKVKKAKDPNAPKRPLSGYFHFCAEARDGVKSENPGLNVGEIAKILGAKWKELDENEKKPYNDKAKADKARYDKEMAKYKGGAAAGDDEDEE
ncbi:high mobility group box domain-containing protein [Paraphysoderma sedebokerense]|nr:high mobility group box domain-containing protein [Paraphysoderma sedebokerense]KAI9140881.1 high mobility group box domain-containing protein [Paraphysoderma sedebokerense]